MVDNVEFGKALNSRYTDGKKLGEQPQEALMQKIAILSLSFFTVLTGAVLAPALPTIQAAYPRVSELWLQSLLTLPSLAYLVMLPWLNRLPFTKKKQVIGGLMLYLIGGLLPIMPLPFEGLAAARLLSGLGLSLFAGPAISLIGDFYPDKTQRRQLLGWASAVTSAGTITSVAAAGWLVTISWHWVFGIYATAVIALIFIWRWLPARPSVASVSAQKVAISPRILTVYGLNLGWNALYFVIPTTVPFYFQSWLHDGDPTHAGLFMAGISGIALLIGINYARIHLPQRLKVSLVFIVLGVAGAGLWWHWPWVTLVAAGTGVALAMPVFNEQVIADTDATHRDGALSIGYAMVFAGQLVSPFIFSGLALNVRLLALMAGAMVLAAVAWWAGRQVASRG